MRLLRPAPGECVDRQSILELKMKCGGTEEPVSTSDEVQSIAETGGTTATIARRKFKSGKVNIQPFIDEHQLIQTYLEKEWFPSLGNQPGADTEFDRLLDALREVNNYIWVATDQAHELFYDRFTKGMEFDYTKAPRAVEILYTTIVQNDKRAELVKKINELFGLNVVEKMFP